MLLEFLEAGVNGLALVRQGLLEQALADGLALNEGVPVHIGLCHAVGEKAHRAVLRGGLVQVRAEVLAGGDYHVVRVVVGCACLGVEGGDVSEVERRLLVALALDGPIRAVLRVLGDKVDSQVCAVVCGRVLPHPHVAEALRVNRVVHEVVPAGALELVSLVALRFACAANPVDYLVYGSRALVRPVDRGSSMSGRIAQDVVLHHGEEGLVEIEHRSRPGLLEPRVEKPDASHGLELIFAGAKSHEVVEQHLHRIFDCWLILGYLEVP